MSKNYNDCDIVFDLLPLYLDQKTGAESNAFLQKHLAGCSECQEVCRLMSADLAEGEAVLPRQAEVTRKRKRGHLTRATKRRIILVVGLLGYLCLMVGIVALAVWLLVYS